MLQPVDSLWIDAKRGIGAVSCLDNSPLVAVTESVSIVLHCVWRVVVTIGIGKACAIVAECVELICREFLPAILSV